MAVWVRVCDESAIPAGEIRGFWIGELAFPVLVAHVGGRFLASTSICPHEDVSLLGGNLEGTVVTCPGHGYEFDLDSGQCGHDAGLRLRRFPVRLIDGAVHIDIDLHRRFG
jgi:nitrite reductase/ring-hydroxylating ferredoxin subunit